MVQNVDNGNIFSTGNIVNVKLLRIQKQESYGKTGILLGRLTSRRPTAVVVLPSQHYFPYSNKSLVNLMMQVSDIAAIKN